MNTAARCSLTRPSANTAADRFHLRRTFLPAQSSRHLRGVRLRPSAGYRARSGTCSEARHGARSIGGTRTRPQGRSLSRNGAIELERLVSVPLTHEPQQRRPLATHPDLPPHPRRRLTPRSHPPRMNSVQVMRRAHRDAIVARVVAAARPEEHVVIVEMSIRNFSGVVDVAFFIGRCRIRRSIRGDRPRPSGLSGHSPPRPGYRMRPVVRMITLTPSSGLAVGRRARDVMACAPAGKPASAGADSSGRASSAQTRSSKRSRRAKKSIAASGRFSQPVVMQ